MKMDYELYRGWGWQPRDIYAVMRKTLMECTLLSSWLFSWLIFTMNRANTITLITNYPISVHFSSILFQHLNPMPIYIQKQRPLFCHHTSRRTAARAAANCETMEFGVITSPHFERVPITNAHADAIVQKPRRRKHNRILTHATRDDNLARDRWRNA